jgi:hypothetical protein
MLTAKAATAARFGKLDAACIDIQKNGRRCEKNAGT